MICRKCHTNNPGSSFYCDECGHPLIRRPGIKKKSISWQVLVIGLFALLVGGYFIAKIVSRSPAKDRPSDASTTRARAPQNVIADNKEQILLAGEVVVKDLGGRERSRLTTVVFGDNWIALPVLSLLEGKTLVFQSGGSEEIQIKAGIWTTGDPLILLKLETGRKGNSPALFPWNQTEPLEWRSFVEKGSLFPVDIISPEKRGTYFSFPSPDVIQGPGVFMQDGHVVGWSYPEQTNHGYLWAGLPGTDLSPHLQVDRFFHNLVPQWRETHFNSVLKMEESLSVVRRLEAFAEGFSMESPFSEDDIPYELKLESIVDRMHNISSELISNGFAKDVARILDEDILIGTQNFSLVKDSALARVESQDYIKAIRFLENIKKNMLEKKRWSISGIDRFHAQLYKDWLRNILEQGGYYSGMVAFEEAKRVFPNDIELHLLGVEIALADKNWTRARELLQMRDYPEAMRDWAGELENEIQEVQENEGAVTIRFNPGSGHIPVKVHLNGSYSFRFILDTGATMCSIPSSAMDKLRLTVDQTTPIWLVSTAGGIAETFEIKLKSVELEGFRVSNVEALIIDIPGYRDYGLLGQNFLNNFHIEIDNQKGILRLKKR